MYTLAIDNNEMNQWLTDCVCVDVSVYVLALRKRGTNLKCWRPRSFVEIDRFEPLNK